MMRTQLERVWAVGHRHERRIDLVAFLAIGLCWVGLLLLCAQPRRTNPAVQATPSAAPDALAVPDALMGAAPPSRAPASPVERDAPRVPPLDGHADGQLVGRVRMHLPWIPPDLLRRISRSRTHDECSALLTEVVEPTVVARLPVRLLGEAQHDRVLTDERGFFRFDGLAPGTYELTA